MNMNIIYKQDKYKPLCFYRKFFINDMKIYIFDNNGTYITKIKSPKEQIDDTSSTYIDCIIVDEKFILYCHQQDKPNWKLTTSIDATDIAVINYIKVYHESKI